MKITIFLKWLIPLLLIKFVGYGQSLTNSLRVHYPFNKNTIDSTANGYDATNYGATLADDRWGVDSSSYYFNGSSNYMEMPEFMSSNDTLWTLSFWFKPTEFSDITYIMSNSTSYDMDIILRTNWLRLNLGAISYLNVYEIPSSDEWYHLALISRNDSVLIYVDDTYLNKLYMGAMGDPGSITLGKLRNSGRYYQGYIDDFRYYNRELSKSEITQLYEIESTQPVTFCDSVTPPTVVYEINNEWDGGNDGYINQAITDNVQSVIHSWSGPNGFTSDLEDISDLVAGIYYDTISYADSGCVFLQEYTVGSSTQCDTITITLAATVTHAIETIGSIDLFVTGNYITPLSYLWSNSSTTQDLTGLEASTYLVTVTDNAGCTANNSYIVRDVLGEATFLSDFEDQTPDPEIGNYRQAISNNGSMNTVPNPDPFGRNTSDYVLKLKTPPAVAGRAEYSTERYPINEKKYFFQWKRYNPSDMFHDVNISIGNSILQNQWSTWPCEAPPVYGPYDYFPEYICDGGGIFTDMHYHPDGTSAFQSRAKPNCNATYFDVPMDQWNQFTLEIYWTQSFNGYYRLWLNDALISYSDNIRTLMERFIEGTCDMFWTNGVYGSWSQTGGMTTDSLAAYVDDIVFFDVDSGYVISDVCPDCEVAPNVTTDSIVYRVNMNFHRMIGDGYNNYITTWAGDTSAINLSSTYGLSNGIDLYLRSGFSASGRNTISDDCFTDDAIQTSLRWSDTITHQLLFRDLNPNNTYTFKLLSASSNSWDIDEGIQIWTTEENKDTVLTHNNSCNMAEIKNLVSDPNGDLIINIKSIDDVTPTGYINFIELVEYNQSALIPENQLVFDTIIVDGENSCFNANNDIIVAGDENLVEIQDGASVNFIAENSIVFLPGFRANNGSYAHAYITLDGSFCDDLSSLIVSAQFEIENRAVQALEIVSKKTCNKGQKMKVFPNPNSGEFTIQLLDFSNEVKLSVYNSLGNMVYEITTCNEKNTINLSCLNRGIYFVLAADNEVLLTQKVIIH